MRTVIPPGRAGLIVLAAALVPVAVKKFRPMVRAVGNGLVNAGKTFQKIADDAERDAQAERERQTRTEDQNTDSAESAGAVQEGEEAVESNQSDQDQNTAREEAPASETASPMGQNEVIVGKTKGTASKANHSGGTRKKAPAKDKEAIKGTTPPAGNAKRARKAGTEDKPV